MTCRNCGVPLSRVFVDLGTSPLSNAYLSAADLDRPEPHFPLRPCICDKCLLVQLRMFETPESIFGGEYAFFSGQSQSWRDHLHEFAADAVRRFKLTRQSRVLEIGSNDGVLLRDMMRWTPNVVGVEPAPNVARHALLKGLPTINRFFTDALALELTAAGYHADLIVANNVLAHVPDLTDFLLGVTRLLAPGGALSIEVPSLARLVEDNQFDTIYHEHFSYFSLHSLTGVLIERGLMPVDVEMLPTHGGSMRVTARHTITDVPWSIHERLTDALKAETAAGYNRRDTHPSYEHRPAELKQTVVETLTQLHHEGKRIAGYGAPAKATTFLSYCGVGPDVIEFIVDSTPAKQGRYLPGARIPILPPDALDEREPDVIVILPWNWRDEIVGKIQRDCPWQPSILCRDELVYGPVAAAA